MNAHSRKAPGTRNTANRTAERVATGLGWFSIGLGLAEVLAPGKLAKFIGVRDTAGNRALLRFYGLRELGAGVGILLQPQPAGWLWSRVGGDMVDLASLGKAMASDGNGKGRLAFATASVLGVTALDIWSARELSGGDQADRVLLSRSIIIDQPVEEVYRYWRDFENLPKFMNHLQSVDVTGPRKSHWRARTPGGLVVDWSAEIVDDQPNKVIAWRSVPNSKIDVSGTVWFERATGDRGTLVRAQLDYRAPGGVVAKPLALMFGEHQLVEDLRAFKQVLETGEVVRSDASIHPRTHAAKPPTDREFNKRQDDFQQPMTPPLSRRLVPA